MRENICPEFTYRFGLSFSNVLTSAERVFVEQIIGYLSQSKFRVPDGEGPSFRWSDTPGTDYVIVYLDLTKSYSDDTAWATVRFFEALPEALAEGSPKYKTDRIAPKGTRLVNRPVACGTIRVVDAFGDSECDTRSLDDWATRLENKAGRQAHAVVTPSGITVSVTVTTAKTTKITILFE